MHRSRPLTATTTTPGTTARRPRRARPRAVPAPLLAEPAPDPAARRDQRDGDGLVRLRARLHRDRAARAGARLDRLLVGRVAVPGRWRRRGPGPPAGDDAADLDGHHRRLRGVDGHEPRPARPRVLVGAGRAGHDHAARPLAGDEGDRPGPGCARRARRAAAGRGRARRRRRRSTRADRSSCGSATSCSCGRVVGCPPTE